MTIERLAVPTRENSLITVKDLERIGYKSYDIDPKSLGDMLDEESRSGQKNFGFINPHKPLRDFKPAATRAAINPNQLHVPDTHLLTTEERYYLIEAINSSLKEEGITGFKASMPDPSTLVQLDRRYREETGKNLIVGLYAYATTGLYQFTETANLQSWWAVGRIHPNNKLVVINCSRGKDTRHVSLIPVFVAV